MLENKKIDLSTLIPEIEPSGKIPPPSYKSIDAYFLMSSQLFKTFFYHHSALRINMSTVDGLRAYDDILNISIDGNVITCTVRVYRNEDEIQNIILNKYQLDMNYVVTDTERDSMLAVDQCIDFLRHGMMHGINLFLKELGRNIKNGITISSMDQLLEMSEKLKKSGLDYYVSIPVYHAYKFFLSIEGQPIFKELLKSRSFRSVMIMKNFFKDVKERFRAYDTEGWKTIGGSNDLYPR